jgi:hypothetical protein
LPLPFEGLDEVGTLVVHGSAEVVNAFVEAVGPARDERDLRLLRRRHREDGEGEEKVEPWPDAHAAGLRKDP